MDVVEYDPNEALENLFNNRSIDFDVEINYDDNVIVISGDEESIDNDIIIISDDESEDTQEEVCIMFISLLYILKVIWQN